MVLQPEVILEVVPPAHSFVRLVTSQKFDSTSGGTARFGRIIKVSDENPAHLKWNYTRVNLRDTIFSKFITTILLNLKFQ